MWHLDEPYGGGLPSWYVFKEMSRDGKVIMTGTGGDELFGNYGKWNVYESVWRFKKPEVILPRFHLADLKRSIKYPFGSRFHRYISDTEKISFPATKQQGILT